MESFIIQIQGNSRLFHLFATVIDFHGKSERFRKNQKFPGRSSSFPEEDMKEVYFPDGVWRIIQHMTTLYVAPTREEGVYIALRNWYLEKSNLLHSYFGIRSFYVKTLKRKKKKKYWKEPYCKRQLSTKKGLAASNEIEHLWFLQKGFLPLKHSWVYYNPDGSIYVEIEKNILHAIHSRQAWFHPKGGDYLLKGYRNLNRREFYHYSTITRQYGPFDAKIGRFNKGKSYPSIRWHLPRVTK